MESNRPRQPSDLRRSLTSNTLDGFFATPHVFINIPGNIILAALSTQVFGIGKTYYGIITALPFLSNALQLFLMPLLASRWSARSISLSFGWANLVVWMAMIAHLPWFPQDDAKAAGRLLFAYLAVSSLFGALGGVGWTSWIQEWVPRRIRGKYFGFRNRVCNLANVSFLLLVGMVIERMENSVSGYMAVFSVAALLRMVGFYFQHSIRARQSLADTPAKGGWLGQLSRMAREQAFLRFVLFSAGMTFLFNFTGPFGPVFMYEQLHLSVHQVTVLTVCATLTGAFSWPIWGYFCDRYGNKPVIIASILLWETQNFLWVIITPQFAWVLYLMWLWGGLTSTGYFLGNFNMLLKLIPREGKTTGISINLAVTSLAAAVGPILAGGILDWVNLHQHNLELAYRAGFFVKSSLVLLLLLVLRWIPEPQQTSDLRTLFGALRSIRLVYQASGLGQMTNIHPARIARGKSASTASKGSTE